MGSSSVVPAALRVRHSLIDTPFPSRLRTAGAALASALAVALLWSYIVGPSWAQPTVSVAYEASAKPVLRGVAKTNDGKPIARAVVVARFRTRAGRTLKTVKVRTDKHGRFRIALPARARTVQVTVRDTAGSGRAIHKTLKVRRGRSLSLTTVFPARPVILPGPIHY